MPIGRDALLDLIRPIWAEDLRQRKQQHANAMQSVDVTCAAKGIGCSGAHVYMAAQASVEESRVRARLCRNVLRKASAQTQTRFSAAELRSLYMALIANMYQDVDVRMKSVLGLRPLSQTQSDNNMLNLAHEQVAAIDKEIAELALYAASVTLKSESGVVIHGPMYGAVQSGAASTSNVIVTFHSDGFAVLRDAIKALRESLQTSPPRDMPEYAAAVIADLETELSREKPESKRVANLLVASESIIATLANAPAAWEAVRHAAALIGISLP